MEISVKRVCALPIQLRRGQRYLQSIFGERSGICCRGDIFRL